MDRDRGDVHAQTARALADVARAIASSHDLEVVLGMIAEQVCALVDAQRSLVVLLGAGEHIRLVASHGLANRFAELRPRHRHDGLAMTAITERRPVWSADVLRDPSFDLSLPFRSAIEAEGYRAALAVPLLADSRV